MSDSDKWPEAEAAREAMIGKANQDSQDALDQNDRPRMHVGEGRGKLPSAEPDYGEPEWVEGTVINMRPELFLLVDYEADGHTDEPDAIWINLNNVETVATFGGLKLTMNSGQKWLVHESDVERFWAQWELIR